MRLLELVEIVYTHMCNTISIATKSHFHGKLIFAKYKIACDRKFTTKKKNLSIKLISRNGSSFNLWEKLSVMENDGFNQEKKKRENWRANNTDQFYFWQGGRLMSMLMQFISLNETRLSLSHSLSPSKINCAELSKVFWPAVVAIAQE